MTEPEERARRAYESTVRAERRACENHAAAADLHETAAALAERRARLAGGETGSRLLDLARTERERAEASRARAETVRRRLRLDGEEA